ncbi:hypothetical protein [Xenophilus azovorans]|uniref:hypothetical protein n=1 Tax=Xenophilus TaxID=151754 RepID=UPI0005705DCC|nr:hypothetical protein [Xenophilus azovorans]
MHSAPSVSYPVGRSRFAAGLFAALWLAGAACAGLWLHQNPADPARAAALATALALTALAAVHALGRVPPSPLAWDGAYWHLGTDGAAMRMATAAAGLDLQGVLLLRLAEPGQAPRWLWLERGWAPERWNALRRAVYCRPPSPEAAPVPAADAGARRVPPAA